MANVKVVLKQSPLDPENGIWIDDVKLDTVQAITINGAVGMVPEVILRFVPKSVVVDVDNPDVIKVTKNE